MSRSVFSDFGSVPDKNAHDFSVSVDGISVAETIGKRDSQQDTIFVAKVRNKEACATPKAFYERVVEEAVHRHKDCENGTTLCSAIVTPPSEEDLKAGKTFPKITIANLGDSRAAIVAKTKDGRYISIILTEDHDLKVPRVRKHFDDCGGEIGFSSESSRTPRAVCRSAAKPILLGMGAAIGDCNARGTDGCHALMTEPDIWEYDLNAFPFVVVLPGGYRQEVLPRDQIQELDLIVSCDGLYDVSGLRKLAADFRVCKNDAGTAFFNDNSEKTEGLSEIKRAFDDEHGEESGSKISFAAALQDLALSELSNDNISIACVNLVSGGKNRITEPLMTTVCDGHGGKEVGRAADSIFSDFSGGEISASVAAMLYRAAEAEHVPGLEMPSGYFHNFLAEAGVVIPALNVVAKEKDEREPSYSVGGGGAGGGSSTAAAQRERGVRFSSAEEAEAAGLPVPPPPFIAPVTGAAVAASPPQVELH